MRRKRIPIFCVATSLVMFILFESSINGNRVWGAEAKYPSRPIEIWCGFGAGGKTDMNTRLLAKGLEKYLNVPVVAGNKPGGGTTIAASALANSPPDGYKLAVLGDSALIISILLGLATYKIEDFCMIGQFNSDAQAMAVNAESPWKTIEGFIDYARKNPGLIYGHNGVGTTLHFRAEYFSKLANIKMSGIPFKSDPEMVAALLGKHIEIGTVSFYGSMPQVQAGKMRVLFNFNIPGHGPFPNIPNIPSLFGKDVYNMGPVANYLLAPAKTPKHIVKILEQALEKVTKDSEFIDGHKKMYLEVVFNDGETVINTIKKDTLEYKRVAQEIGLIK